MLWMVDGWVDSDRGLQACGTVFPGEIRLVGGWEEKVAEEQGTVLVQAENMLK
jgi:hypothetical protein